MLAPPKVGAAGEAAGVVEAPKENFGAEDELPPPKEGTAAPKDGAEDEALLPKANDGAGAAVAAGIEGVAGVVEAAPNEKEGCVLNVGLSGAR